jgi:hypothetical protein
VGVADAREAVRALASALKWRAHWP